MGFAFVDVETTGFSPEHHDRIVEIAIVTTDEWLQPVRSFESLVNPQRDVGPTSLHGVPATQVLAAPTFAEIASSIAAMLNGHVLAAHNLAFDQRFLTHELSVAGVSHEMGSGLCSMGLARRAGWPLKLEELVGKLRIDRQGISHSAMSDTLACLEVCRRRPGFTGKPFQSDATDPDTPLARTLKREIAEWTVARRSHFASIPDAGSDAANSYLDLISTCVADGQLDAEERRALNDVIQSSGFSHEVVIDLHHRYIHNVVERATADGVVDANEWNEIATASHLLGVDIEVPRVMAHASLAAPPDSQALNIVAGMTICLTGECDIPREELSWAAEGAGFYVSANLTKKVDVLVCADPGSQSGKAKKARDYGIPAITYDSFVDIIQLD